MLLLSGLGSAFLIGGVVSDGRPSVLILLITGAAVIGIAGLILNATGRVVVFFSPKAGGPEITIAKMAKKYSKIGDKERATRLYAELVTYGYCDNFYVNTEKAYDYWASLGTSAETINYSRTFRELLFYERLCQHIEFRERGHEATGAALRYLYNVVQVAIDSPNLHELGEIYRGEKYVSRVGPALNGIFYYTPGSVIDGPKDLQRVPGLAPAFY
jgi:hypothetical protein